MQWNDLPAPVLAQLRHGAVIPAQSATGEDTLYLKEQTSGAEADEFIVEGWSVAAQTRTAVFGGGTVTGSCRISTSTTRYIACSRAADRGVRHPSTAMHGAR